MEQIRTLWLEDGQCILFNSLSKKISGISPGIVGRVAEQASKGTNVMSALLSEKVDYLVGLRVIDLIERMKSDGMLAGSLSIPMNARKFNRLLALAPTTMCSLQCTYCSGNSGDAPRHMMDWELAKAAIDYFFEHSAETGPYTLQFHGAGEPMVNADVVFRSVAYARDIVARRNRQLFTRITTNGVFSKEMARMLAENFQHVTLSLDGPPYIHNKQRPMKNGSASYQNVIDTLHILEDKGVLKRLNTVVTNEGLERMEEILRHIRAVSNVRQLRLLPMEYCGRCVNAQAMELDMRKFNKNFAELLPVANELGFEMLSVIEQADYYTDHYCGACGFNMCVTPDGNVSTCIEAMDVNDKATKELFIGEYKNNEISIDWDKVFRLRTRTHQSFGECKECIFRTNCAGNCLIRAARKNGSVMSVDSDSCERTKSVLTKHFIHLAKSVPQATEDMTFQKLVELSLNVAKHFNEINQRQWSVEASMIELMKQVGDLSRCFMMKENYYLPSRKAHPGYRASTDDIANELADILHNVICIAHHYQIDLADAAMKARYDELGYVYENTEGGR